ncbi:C40 family peptidase [Brachybacterium nesterenkovii]|uniref:C40 family peptidase n=1 Tax=Brachybacterium nesterenkovii TaxID=47847 RepID=UPI000B360587|nr:peptidoglycan-binding domain-containing protein [Brachybacterium nesterenkovii]
MSQNNTHRAIGRAVTPVGIAGRALRGTDGAAVLGTVVLGSALLSGPAQAAPTALPAAPTVTAQAAAPATPAPAHATSALGAEKLRWGSQGSSVERLQTALNEHGASLSVDGKFGRLTHGAVKDFQRSHDLKIDGVVGPQTRGALNGGGASISTGGTSAPAPAHSATNSQQAIVDAARSQVGVSYSWGTSKPGDLVVWPGHLGIYAGGNTVIDAGNSKGSVSERTIWGSPTFVTFR